ncbi:MAG: hypothetical protein A2233_02650 [Candidatus Kerfeldbacteria bacterium RIFOXYA2_FULL_38_24]|uniref:histidine kinase n=1 Tax=Candidatus Kerfeldbacteria bacterium RIFOXYB2_FULL_38_14 TaxID=1798547 RepID=A0A1G2BJ56_9BACT|nr:MAG: hypothetical protein A2233_02650 [Candidatus Kerfeldbacteria bacterium RIFOXYA2_FULL_38_24]OGY88330.1 MAG: hypothetical protein A2319_03360 [Candidatus Kerfeldbacteria bacterium RIFOXYB2_FULL_38_14]OGY89317.1 MAG: hypothetical protein A2458_05185 [Candidatus Kerfeldbacteria bacterium RIFOXYC2_FULL_38_9]
MFDINDILLLVIYSSEIFFALLILFKHRENLVSKSFSFFIFCIVGWGLSLLLIQNIPNVFFGKLAFLFGSLTPIALIFFSLTFPNKKQFSKKNYWFFLPTFFFVLISLIPNTLFLGLATDNGFIETSRGLFYYPFILYVLLYFFIAIYFLYIAYKKTQNIERLQFRFFLLGLGIFSILSLCSNVILPAFGINQLNQWGPAFSIVLIVFTSYAILKYRLFDIKIQAQRIINKILPIIISVSIIIFLALILYHRTSIDRTKIGIAILILYSVLYVLFTYLFSRTRLSHILFYKTHAYQKALQSLAQEAATIIDLDFLANRIADTLVDKMSVNKAAILIIPSVKIKSECYEFEVLKEINFPAENLKVFLHLNHDIIAAFTNSHLSFVYDELEYELQKNTSLLQKQKLLAAKELCESSDAAAILGLRVQKTLLGFIVLGKKETKKTYSSEDINLLEDVSKELAIALLNSKLHQEETKKSELLQNEVEKAVEAWKQKSQENEELSNLRSQFIAVMSHQLRTPISVIRNSLDLVLEDYLGVAKKEDTQISAEQMGHIVGLLNNALLASENLKNTTESIMSSSEFIGSVPGVQIKRIDSKGFFDQRINRAKRLLEAKSFNKIVFNCAISETIPAEFISDEKKFSQIIDNLLTNAVMYTIEGSVQFSVDAKDGYFVMSISDTGVGIPKADQYKIFQRFIRMDNAQRVVPDGSGLGLYLARVYTNLLRGSITFKSEEGKGTTFVVKIPIEYSYIASK